jgi:hypothetical protein
MATRTITAREAVSGEAMAVTARRERQGYGTSPRQRIGGHASADEFAIKSSPGHSRDTRRGRYQQHIQNTEVFPIRRA